MRDAKDHIDLQEFLRKNKIPAEIIEMPRLTKTAQQAADVLGIDINNIIKSVVFVTKSGSGIVAIVNGEKRVSFEKVEKIVGETVNTASPDDVLRLTGYKAGAVPPIDTGLRTIMDVNVMKNDFCYAGGGTDMHLIKISPQVIKKFTNAEVAEIAK